MICENCRKDHDGLYGSGRFCSSKCARGFSTKNKRAEISKKVSAKMKGMSASGKPFVSGFDPRRKPFSEEDRLRAIAATREKSQAVYESKSFDELKRAQKRRRVLEEQNNKCIACGNDTWLGSPLVIEIHHIDGDKHNNTRENIIGLCPNCHSQTNNWKTRGGINKYA